MALFQIVSGVGTIDYQRKSGLAFIEVPTSEIIVIIQIILIFSPQMAKSVVY